MLALLTPLGGTALAETPEIVSPLPVLLLPVPLPPVLVREALAAVPELQPAAQMPLPGDLTLHVAVPADDHCSPQAAWLICPGLRLASLGAGDDAPVLAVWRTVLPEAPLPLAVLRRAVLDQHGPPAWESQEVDQRWGFALRLHRMGWTLAEREPPLLLEASFVLEDAEATGPEPKVQRIGWFAMPKD